MRTTWKTASIALCTTALFAIGTASAQTTNTQDLDKVIIYGESGIADLVFGEGEQVSSISVTPGNFTTCKLTALDGLFCLDSKIVRNWADLTIPEGEEFVPLTEEFYCEDASLGLDRKKVNTCTGMTVDDDGNVWLAGKNKGKSHSLILLMSKEDPAAECPQPSYTGATELGPLVENSGWCGFEVATGRPLLVDLAPVEAFSIGDRDPQNAILGLEGGKTAVAFLEDGDIVEIASGKSDWVLAGKERLQGIALLRPEDTAKEFVLAVTSMGRVLAWDTAGPGPADEVRTFASATCASTAPVYDIRVSSITGIIYLSDSERCETVALNANFSNGPSTLVLATEYDDPSVSTDGFTGVTVAPGNMVDLADCSGKCAIAKSGNKDLITLEGVQLHTDSKSGISFYRVEGIPDCRYLTPTPDVCDAEGIILSLDPDDENNATAQRLNLMPLLPALITDQLPADLQLWVPHYLRGQSPNFLIDGLFGITQDGVVFRETFESRYVVEDLGGSSRGCEKTYGTLDWDVIGMVSDKFISADDLHLMTIINSRCGSSRSRDPNFSFKPYNLEPTPCTFNPYPEEGIWKSDGCGQHGNGESGPDDAVYAKMLLILADEYRRTVEQLACNDVDGNGGVAPLSTSNCGLVKDKVINMTDKLHRCWDAAQQPKESSSNQNCQAFVSQLEGLRALLDEFEPADPDKANRLGELKARAMTMEHIFHTRFMLMLLDLPDEHFAEPQE